MKRHFVTTVAVCTHTTNKPHVHINMNTYEQILGSICYSFLILHIIYYSCINIIEIYFSELLCLIDFCFHLLYFVCCFYYKTTS